MAKDEPLYLKVKESDGVILGAEGAETFLKTLESLDLLAEGWEVTRAIEITSYHALIFHGSLHSSVALRFQGDEPVYWTYKERSSCSCPG